MMSRKILQYQLVVLYCGMGLGTSICKSVIRIGNTMVKSWAILIYSSYLITNGRPEIPTVKSLSGPLPICST